MEYPWYEEIQKSDNISQGDIILNCMIPMPQKEWFHALLNPDVPFESQALEIMQPDLIVLSQSCDIANNKIDSIVTCPIWNLTKWISVSDYNKSKNGKESLRQGKEPAYHLLNKYSSDGITQEFSVVDFHRIYSLPKEYLKSYVETIKMRLRLLPPYREHLSQAFARYFMRVGLPTDISKEEIKKVK
ncbi:MAG: hypothetical protein KAH48_05690 [Chlorobi bacterium]|nr:hypothetical protein [Chlorobiota bacterium]